MEKQDCVNDLLTEFGSDVHPADIAEAIRESRQSKRAKGFLIVNEGCLYRPSNPQTLSGAVDQETYIPIVSMSGKDIAKAYYSDGNARIYLAETQQYYRVVSISVSGDITLEAVGVEASDKASMKPN